MKLSYRLNKYPDRVRGGYVKIAQLQKHWPETYHHANLHYVVSSVLALSTPLRVAMSRKPVIFEMRVRSDGPQP